MNNVIIFDIALDVLFDLASSLELEGQAPEQTALECPLNRNEVIAMNQYIFLYTAKMHPRGTIKGRVEARNGLEAQNKIKDSNLMVNSVSVKVAANQAAARKLKFEVYP